MKQRSAKYYTICVFALKCLPFSLQELHLELENVQDGVSAYVCKINSFLDSNFPPTQSNPLEFSNTACVLFLLSVSHLFMPMPLLAPSWVAFLDLYFSNTSPKKIKVQSVLPSKKSRIVFEQWNRCKHCVQKESKCKKKKVSSVQVRVQNRGI